MRVLVISDTHGSLRNFKEVWKNEQPIDMIMHCGDICLDEEELREVAGPACAVAIVRGNCDPFSKEPDERNFKLGNHQIHMEHGHRLPDSLQAISYKAESIGADLIFFGHTHCPLVTRMGGVRIVNPGSLSRPRQSDHCPSYVIMEVGPDGEISLELKKL